MPDYTTPGVYIEEISTLPASVAAVATAIPAFIGHTEIAEKDGDDLEGVPTRITSMLDYNQYFGGPNPEALQVEVTDTLQKTTGEDPVLTERNINVQAPSSVSDYKMYYAMQMYFNNGGGPCYIISVGDYGDSVTAGDSTTINTLIWGLDKLAKVDEPTLIVFPDYMPVSDYSDVYNAALAQCAKLQDRFTIMDVKDVTGDPLADATDFRDNGVGISDLKYGATYYPNIKTNLNYGHADDLTITRTYIYNGDAAESGDPSDGTVDLDELVGSDPNLVDPTLHRSILAEISKLFIEMAPSPAMAGIYARVDRQRGVWKAPANVDVRSAIGPSVKVTHEQQGNLNVDPTSGKSVNAVRTFTGKGTLVWGARTLAGNDNEWRYIPVRRLYIFIEESVKKATEFVVFEPNDANTWLRVKTMIENFLSKLWRDGALAGAKAEEAFFVKVGLGQTMSSLDILEGRMNIEIGLAAVRPAEFIILKFSHKLQES